MKINSTISRAAFAALGLLALFSCGGCETGACDALTGRWSTREGQSILFQKNGKALWITRFGSQMDTVPMAFRCDGRGQPTSLDLFGFRSGPLVGKTLFGIIEWTSDSTFRYNADAGTDSGVRPTTFESDQTMTFFLERTGNTNTE